MGCLKRRPTKSQFVSARGGDIQRRRDRRLSSRLNTSYLSSRKQNQQTFRLSHGVFLMLLWLSIFVSAEMLVGEVVTAEESIIPSIPSPSLHASFESKSKARIVIPSSPCEDEYNIIDRKELDIPIFDSLSEKFCDNAMSTLEGSHLGRTSPQLLLQLSTPTACLHRSSTISTDIGNNEEGLDNSIHIDRLSAPISQARSNFKKTGTTIAGCVVPGNDSDGPYVVLAADTRATANTLVADKRCDKIHKLASNCRCCGAGTSADLDKITREVAYQMALQELQNNSIGNGSINTEERKTDTSVNMELLYPAHGQSDFDGAVKPLLWMRPVSIEILCNIFQDKLFRSKGQLGANLIVGGVWNKKAYLRAIHPHGSTDIDLPFTALGSGGLAAMAVLEEGYRPSLTLEDGIKLVQRAVLSGIRNDLGSGSQVDLCVIDPDGVCRQTRGVIPEEELLPDGERDDGIGNIKDTRNRTNHLLKLLSRSKINRGEDEIEKNTSNKDIGVGVNGFGNQPFSIRSTKQRMISFDKDQAKQEEIWDMVLGL